MERRQTVRFWDSLVVQADTILPRMWFSKVDWTVYVLLNLEMKSPLTLVRNKSK